MPATVDGAPLDADEKTDPALGVPTFLGPLPGWPAACCLHPQARSSAGVTLRCFSSQKHQGHPKCRVLSPHTDWLRYFLFVFLSLML